MKEDIHIASVITIKSTTVIKPQTATICYGKVKYNPDLPTEQSYQISSADRAFLVKEPGLQIVNSVSRLQSDRSILILVVNKTNKTMRIFRHGILAKLESDFSKVTEGNSILKSPDVGDHLDLKDLDVTQEFHGDTERLILWNQDLFASKDTDLGHTETVQMKIDRRFQANQNVSI